MEGANLNATDDNGKSALLVAAEAGENLWIINASERASKSKSNKLKMIYSKCFRLRKYAKGANWQRSVHRCSQQWPKFGVDFYNSFGYSFKNSYTLFQLLLQTFKNTIFFGEGFDKAAELLIEKGADVNIVGKNKQTALTWAAYSGKFLLF